MVLGICVPKDEAEQVRRKLLKKGLLSDEWQIRVDDNHVIFPLRGWIEGAEEFYFERRRKKIPPYDRIVSLLRERGINFEVPRRWERIGDVLLLPPLNVPEENVEEVAEIYASVLRVKTVAIYEGVLGEFRENRIRVIWGDGTETIHVENGIRYAMDVSRVMFSSGNVDERIRISRIDMRGETVVDMFAGIGYFTLPAAKAGARRIYASEKNPVAYFYLLKNIELNNFQNIIPLFGDNRSVCPEGIADRVIMGYFDTLPFLPYGLRSLRREGGVIHYHDLSRDKNAEELKSKVLKIVKGEGYGATRVETRVIKSYAPRLWHVVLDLYLRAEG